MKLANTLKKLMKESELSFKALSKKAAVPESTIKQWAQGAAPRKLSDVKKVAKVLGVSFEFLCFGEEDDSLPRTLQELLTEPVYEGWLKVKIERAIPNKK